MKDLNTICREIRFGDLGNEELNLIGEAIRYRRSVLARATVSNLTQGVSVRFTNSRTGKVIVGTIEKINRKTVVVREAHVGLWRVPANMLETV